MFWMELRQVQVQIVEWARLQERSENDLENRNLVHVNFIGRTDFNFFF